MFEIFRKKKEPEVIHHKYDILPHFDWENATSETATEYFKKLTRIQMLEIYDREIPDHLWDEYYDVMNTHKYWPTDEDILEAWKRLSSNYGGRESIEFQVKELVKQVTGMQKKLDRITVLLSNAKFELCGEDALKL